MQEQHVLIFDGLNLFIRNFCVNPITDINGQAMGGFVGSLISIKKLVESFPTTNVIVVFDGKGGSTRRRKIYSEYKAGRKPRLNRADGTDDETVDESKQNMRDQFSLLKKYLTMFSITQIEIENLEADDVIAELCVHNLSDINKTIISTDGDMLQLVDANTDVYSPTKKILYKSSSFLQDIGYPSKNVSIFKSLCGDKSDNVKGIIGLGEKTLLKLFPLLSTEEYTLSRIFTEAQQRVAALKDNKLRNHSEFTRLNQIIAAMDVVANNFKVVQLASPVISSQASRKIRYSLVKNNNTNNFNASLFKISLNQDGIQFTDADLLDSYARLYNRSKVYKLSIDNTESLEENLDNDNDNG